MRPSSKGYSIEERTRSHLSIPTDCFNFYVFLSSLPSLCLPSSRITDPGPKLMFGLISPFFFISWATVLILTSFTTTLSSFLSHRAPQQQSAPPAPHLGSKGTEIVLYVMVVRLCAVVHSSQLPPFFPLLSISLCPSPRSLPPPHPVPGLSSLFVPFSPSFSYYFLLSLLLSPSLLMSLLDSALASSTRQY